MRLSSDRTFGLVFAAFFTIIALAPLRHSAPPRLWFLGAAGLLLLISLVYPRHLHGPNLLWAQFGLLLHRIFSPLVLGLLFFGVFTPIGLLYRLRGGSSSTPKPGSYWIPREPPGPSAESLADQF